MVHRKIIVYCKTKSKFLNLCQVFSFLFVLAIFRALFDYTSWHDKQLLKAFLKLHLYGKLKNGIHPNLKTKISSDSRILFKCFITLFSFNLEKEYNLLLIQ